MSAKSDNKTQVTVRPAKAIAGSVRLPGDKSISHRYAMLAGIARGRTVLRNFATGADCASTLACMSALGARVEREGDGAVVIEGRGPELAAPAAALDCGNSGSTMRMLAGIVAAQSFESEMTGDSSLTRRPMGGIMEPLERMGARLESAEGGRPPLRVRGGRLRGIEYRLPVASAQVKS